MKRKGFSPVYAGILLAVLLGFTGCKDEPETDYGSLTIRNLPADLAAFEPDVWFNPGTMNNSIAFWNWVTDSSKELAYTNDTASPYKLIDSNTFDGFSRTGRYMVKIGMTYAHESAWFIITQFNEGKADIDFNDMSKLYED